MNTTSTIPQDLATTRNLTNREQRAELATARVILAEALTLAGLDPVVELARVKLTMSTAMTSSMGIARTDNWSSLAPVAGRINLAASALWLHASPTKRRNTIIHEFAHLIANREMGKPEKGAKRKSHGVVWKRWMVRLGEANPVRCHKVPKARPTTRRRGPRAKALDSLAMLIGRSAAEAIHRVRPAAADKFSRGQVVLVGRARGEQTRCKVTRVNGKSLTVETLEPRAGQPAGMKMRASFSLCRPVDQGGE
jgi:hypothetical protein